MTEVKSPLMVEDFEEGNRIYTHDGMRHYEFRHRGFHGS